MIWCARRVLTLLYIGCARHLFYGLQAYMWVTGLGANSELRRNPRSCEGVTPKVRWVYSARSLAVTTQVSRCGYRSFRRLAGQIWLGKFGCASVYESVAGTF